MNLLPSMAGNPLTPTMASSYVCHRTAHPRIYSSHFRQKSTLDHNQPSFEATQTI
jgi:hypothetical protein